MGPVAPIEVSELRHTGIVETGVDTWRLLFRADASGVGKHVFAHGDYTANWFPAHGLLALEGHPAGRGALAPTTDLPRAMDEAQALADDFGGTFAGVARADLTAGYRFPTDAEGRAFFSGMASIDLTRCETTRRGHPPHSVWWTGQKGRAIKARVYDKGLERGTAPPFTLGRLEVQEKMRASTRVDVPTLADPDWTRGTFGKRFDSVRKAVDGVKAASFPVIAQALADEARYGYRPVREAERLAGALVLLTGGAAEGYSRATYYRRRAELREAGYVVATDLIEPVEVNLGEVIESALGAAW